jgi:hypothetical protein
MAGLRSTRDSYVSTLVSLANSRSMVCSDSRLQSCFFEERGLLGPASFMRFSLGRDEGSDISTRGVYRFTREVSPAGKCDEGKVSLIVLVQRKMVWPRPTIVKLLYNALRICRETLSSSPGQRGISRSLPDSHSAKLASPEARHVKIERKRRKVSFL